MSQQQLADQLQIKRSNIAAYETKNVEPRLSLISDIAALFKVSLARLITIDLETTAEFLGSATTDSELPFDIDLPLANSEDARNLWNQSHDIQAMLEGFRIFYQYKRDKVEVANEIERRRINGDVENFLIFIDHMLQYNQDIINMLGSVKPAEGTQEQVQGEGFTSLPSH